MTWADEMNGWNGGMGWMDGRYRSEMGAINESGEKGVSF